MCLISDAKMFFVVITLIPVAVSLSMFVCVATMHISTKMHVTTKSAICETEINNRAYY